LQKETEKQKGFVRNIQNEKREDSLRCVIDRSLKATEAFQKDIKAKGYLKESPLRTDIRMVAEEKSQRHKSSSNHRDRVETSPSNINQDEFKLLNIYHIEKNYLPIVYNA